MKFNIAGLPVNFDLVKFLKENTNNETINTVGDFMVEILRRNQNVRQMLVDVLLYSDEGKGFLEKIGGTQDV